jgi:hypothetical protein
MYRDTWYVETLADMVTTNNKTMVRGTFALAAISLVLLLAYDVSHSPSRSRSLGVQGVWTGK